MIPHAGGEPLRDAPVYSPPMQMVQQPMARRVYAVLEARQRVVVFAIALAALDTAAPLVAAWAVRHRPVAALVDEAQTPLAEAVSGASVLAAAVFLISLSLAAWLRAGFLRSLAGPFRLGPRDGRQYRRLLGLQLLLAVVGAAATGVLALVAGDPAIALLLVVALVPVSLAALYADFAIVLGDQGVLGGIITSLRLARLHLPLSITVVVTVMMVSALTAGLLTEEATTSLSHALPMFVVRWVLLGCVTFVADAVLLVVFQTPRGTPHVGR